MTNIRYAQPLPQFGRRVDDPVFGPNCTKDGSITPQLSDDVLTMLRIPVRLEVVYLGSCSGGEGGGPSKLRLPKDGGGGLPKDVTVRRPDVGEGEGMVRSVPGEQAQSDGGKGVGEDGSGRTEVSTNVTMVAGAGDNQHRRTCLRIRKRLGHLCKGQ